MSGASGIFVFLLGGFSGVLATTLMYKPLVDRNFDLRMYITDQYIEAQYDISTLKKVCGSPCEKIELRTDKSN